jgi:cytochrome c-type biogenesis protein CcmH/NrfG
VLAGDTKSAIKRYEKLLRRHPGASQRARDSPTRAASRRERPAQAAFLAVLEKRPEHVPALVGMGSVAIRNGDMDGAVALYKRAAAVAPDDSVVRKRLASLKLQLTDRRMSEAQARARAQGTRRRPRPIAARSTWRPS